MGAITQLDEIYVNNECLEMLSREDSNTSNILSLK